MTKLLATGVIAACWFTSSIAFGQSASFTYQGQLKQAGVPVDGTFSIDFSLWDAVAAGTLQAGPIHRPNTQVTNGLFNASLDFGPEVFAGARFWLEVIVDGVPLAPRQELTATPYALHSAAPWVTNGQNISYVQGAVGVGTSAPAHPLDVAGDTKLRERLAVGNDAGFGSNSPYGYSDFDISHIHSDFATSQYWSAFRSYITFDPNFDLFPPNSLLFSHDFECLTPATNNHNFNYVQGPYLGSFHKGGGHVGLLAGGNIVAQTTGTGSVDLQIGGYITSILGTGGEGTGTIQRNEGLEVITGNAGAAGAMITNDYSMYVFSPNHDQPMTNHYGIYLEDQDFGLNDRYAIYSAGGKNYLAGNLGIGTSEPQAKLHIGGVAGVDGIMFPDGSLQTTAAGTVVGGESVWSQGAGNKIFYSLGNVGIGTSSPAQLLTLQTPTNSYGLLHTDGVRSIATYLGGAGNGGYIGTKSNHSLHLYANDSDPLLTVHPNRNVGIGTLTPASKLDIAAVGDGAELLRLSTERPWVFRQVRTGPTTGLQLRSTVGLKAFEITTVEGNNVATFLADGVNSKVGIGTTNPAAKLHVEGGADPSLGGGGNIVTGSTTGVNTVIGDNEIQARFNGGPFGLVINNEGGDVVFGGAIDIGYEIVSGENDALCPPGKKVLGGGCDIAGDAEIRVSRPLDNGWHCAAGDVSGFYGISTYAICARVK